MRYRSIEHSLAGEAVWGEGMHPCADGGFVDMLRVRRKCGRPQAWEILEILER